MAHNALPPDEIDPAAYAARVPTQEHGRFRHDNFAVLQACIESFPPHDADRMLAVAGDENPTARACEYAKVLNERGRVIASRLGQKGVHGYLMGLETVHAYIKELSRESRGTSQTSPDWQTAFGYARDNGGNYPEISLGLLLHRRANGNIRIGRAMAGNKEHGVIASRLIVAAYGATLMLSDNA